MTLYYGNSLAFPICRTSENINKSNFINKHDLNQTHSKSNKKNCFFGRDITNTVVKNPKVSHSLLNTKIKPLNFDDKSINFGFEGSDESDDSWDLNFFSSNTSSSMDSPERYNMSLVDSPPFGSPIKYASSNENSPASKKRTNLHLDENLVNIVPLSPLKKNALHDFFNSKEPVAPVAPSKLRPLKPGTFAYKVMELTKTDIFEYQSATGPVNFQIGAKPIGKGHYCEVFDIISSDGELVRGYKNEQIVFKRYHKEIIERRREIVEKFVEGTLDQYHLLSEAFLGDEKFPIAKIFNAATAKEDGYFLVEKIPCEFTHDKLDQVKAMLQFAFDEGISLDLSRDNVRVNDEGRVVLIDFMEEKQGKIQYLIEKHIESFAKGDEEIKAYLRPVGYVKLG